MIASVSVVIMATAVLVRAETLHVPGDFQSVQSAIDAASDGDTIVLGKGVHRGGVDMLGKAITLRGECGAEFTAIMGGEGVIRCVNGEGPATVIEGLTIAGGTGRLDADGLRRGGGLLLVDASPMIRLCLVVGNTADRGAAAWIANGVPVFEDCWFHDNISEQTDGIVCEGTAPKFIRCGFHEDGVQWADAPIVSIRNDCDQPGGACCLGNHCVETTNEACMAAGGFWHANAACGSGVCPSPCLGDTNTDRRVNHTDLLNVLNNWGMCQ